MGFDETAVRDGAGANVLQNAIIDQADHGVEAVAVVDGGREQGIDARRAAHCCNDLGDRCDVVLAPCATSAMDQPRIVSADASDVLTGTDRKIIGEPFGRLRPDQVDRFRDPAGGNPLRRLYCECDFAAAFQVSHQIERVLSLFVVDVSDRILISNIVHVRMGEEDVCEIAFEAALVGDFSVLLGIHEGSAG